MAQSLCQPSFNYSVGANGNVTFFGTAVGYSSVAPNGATFTWFYGYNNGTSTSTVPAGNYSYPNGTYTVVLLYINGAQTCSATIAQTITVNNSNNCGVNANFSYTQGANGNVSFNNTSTGTTGGTTYNWYFGDGGTSGSQSPTHTYASNGTYQAKLVVINSLSPLCIDSVMFNVNVNSYCNVTGGFTYSQNNSFFNFTNTSTGAAGYQWNFGDGGTAGGANPTHNYASTGTFTVTMIAFSGFTVSPGACADTVVQVVTVNSVCVADATFSLTPTGTPQYWNAFPLFPANVTNATWSWGDGSVSNTLYTNHTYSAAGMYTICLSLTVSCGATDMYCNTYNIYRSAQDMNIITVNVINPLTVGLNSQVAEELNYSISPNPNNGSFHLNMNGMGSGPVNISVYNLVGKLVYQSENNSSNGALVKDIQLNDVSSGVYFIKVASDDRVTTKKVVIENNK
jgi:PKD repeat protein